MAAVRFVGNRLDKATLNALVAGTLVNGSKPSVWWARQSAEFRNTFMDTVRTSMRNGESLQQAITRVVGGTIDGVTAPGIIQQSKRKAGALVSTSMSAVTNEAALKSFQANNDVIKAVTQLSTLDNRTSDVCIAYSGQTWNLMTLEPIAGSSLPFNGGPPRHFNCRSRLRPVTKSFKELGVDAPEIPPGTRASMDGQVPADITFNQFLRNKPASFADDLLGPKRAQLWRNGDINLTQLVDMRGNPLTISQLEARIGIKPKPKFNPATNQTINKPKPTAKKKTVDSFLENDDGTFVQITQAEHDEITGWAKTLTERAAAADDVVTAQIKGLADDVGAWFPDAPIVKDGPMVTEGSLHWRMKDMKSTSRKIQTYARDKGLSYNEAAEQISDSLRFTYVVDEDNYVKAVQETMERFAELGYKNGKFDPAWLTRPDYKGLNINMITPEGVKMELQFHTAKSFDIKNGINHELYEKFRTLSKAKQKGPEGQALQKAMLDNANSIPVPKNIELLEDMAKTYSKPTPEMQKQILEQGAKRVQFEKTVAARLAEGDLQQATKVILAADDVIPDKLKKEALEQIEKTREAAAKQSDKLIAEKGFKDIPSKEKFNEAFINLLDEIDEAGLPMATRLDVVEKLKAMRTAHAEKFATEDLMFHQVMGNYNEAKKVAATIENPSPAFQKLVKELEDDHIKSTEKKVRLALENGDEKDALKTLLDFGDTKDAPNLKALHKEIQKGNALFESRLQNIVVGSDFVEDMDDFAALVKKQISGDDVPKWVWKKVLDDPMFAAAEESAKFRPVVNLGKKTLIEGDLVKVKDILDGIPETVFGRSDLAKAWAKAKQKQDDLIKFEFPKKVKDIATKEFGFSVDDIPLLATPIDTMAVQFNGVITEGFKTGLRKELGAARIQLRTHMDKVKALNKASKGLDEIVAYADQMPTKFSAHPEFQAVVKKATKQAQKKASVARQEILNEMIETGQLVADDIIKYGDNILKAAMKDVNKKLGKAQKKAKIAEVKAKVAAANNKEVSIAQFADDITKYDEQVKNLLSQQEMGQLRNAVDMFKNEGAGSSAARENMIQVLKYKSPDQVRAIKEFVHSRTNPKTLPSGENFNAKVAEIVTKHVNNTDHAVIRAHVDAMTKGADASTKMMFEQTIFTRTGVKNFDQLGVKKAGGSKIDDIRAMLDIDDPGNTPIPVHTREEQMQAAKVWLHSRNIDETEFKRQTLRMSKQHVANGKGRIQEGDRIFGENSWGITKAEWDDWAKNVAPTLDEWDVALIHEYTGGMAGRINAGLYNGGMDKDWTAGARALNTALDKMPKHTGTVYRGTNARSNWTADYIDARYEVGKEVVERGFGSSATQASAQFNGDLKFVIKTKGQNGAIIGHVGQYGVSEMEVLFKAGTRFIVRRKEREGSKITVYMEEVVDGGP